MYAVRSHAIQPVSCGALPGRAANTVAANDALGGVSGSKIRLERFATHPLPRSQQLAAWRDWYDSVFDIDSRQDPETGFAAESMTWKLDHFAISHVSTPPVSLDRTRALIRRNPVDHWAIILGTRSGTELRYRDATLTVPARVPFVVSLADERNCTRMQDERIVLFLARESFQGIVPVLDAACGSPLDTPLGRLLGDYMIALWRRLPDMTEADASGLAKTIGAMVAAAVAPSAERVAVARRQIDLGRKERVRQAVFKHLRTPTLGPRTLSRLVGMSRSNLYRLFEDTGGISRYIQRQRLLEARAVLTDLATTRSISAIAEDLCFVDASGFSRTFRREFGHSPSEARSAALAGLALSGTPKRRVQSDRADYAALLCGLNETASQ
jgi:AraC-like DNA-binding protein